MHLTFNELTLPAAKRTEDVGAKMRVLRETVKAARRRGVATGLRVRADIWQQSLAPDYLVTQYVNDNSVTREERQWLRTAISKLTTVEDVLANHATVREFVVGDRLATGVGVAVIEDSAVIGFHGCGHDDDPFAVKVTTLSGDALIETELLLPNLVCVAAVEAEMRSQWIRDRVLQDFTCGDDIIRVIADVFPHLELCEFAQDALADLGGSQTVFRFVAAHLYAFNIRAAVWSGGDFYGGLTINCSTESERTLNEYGDERTFTCRNGQRRVFSWHSKIGPGAWRIHFEHDSSRNKVVVGYIGPHLRTAT